MHNINILYGILVVFFTGYFDYVYKEGDLLLVIHSRENPYLPGKFLMNITLKVKSFKYKIDIYTH